MYLRCPVGHRHSNPNNLQNHYQELRRYICHQKRERPRYDPFRRSRSRWVCYCSMCLRCPVGLCCFAPNRILHQCSGWRRYDSHQKRERLRYDPFQGCWLAQESIGTYYWTLFGYYYIPNRRQHRCQEWRKYGNVQKRWRQRYDPFQGCWSRRVSFRLPDHQCPVFLSFPTPNRILNRCHEWRRCEIVLRKALYL